jgi:Tfp pilus assembly protein PilF
MKVGGFLLVVAVALVSAAGCTRGPAGEEIAADDVEGLNQLRRSDPATAAARLRDYLANHPDDDKAWTVLGHACKDLDEVDDAEAAYQRALEINPRRFEALTGQGILCRKKGRYGQALAWYEKALAVDATHAHAYSSMTVIALKQNDDARALEYAKKGYALDSTDPAIVANLAVACHYNGLWELRDEKTAEAKQLGYPKIDVLEQIYRGEITVKD